MSAIEIPDLALSVRQPWGYAILHLGKDVENRTWSTKFRGRLALHVSAGKPDVDAIETVYTLTDQKAHLGMANDLQSAVLAAPRGCIAGVVTVVDCVPVKKVSSRWRDRSGFAWLLEDAVALDEPIPCRGRLSLFRWRDSGPARARRSAPPNRAGACG